MRFSDDFINRVRDASNIVEVISHYTELKRAGNNVMGRCPFPDHREKTPSFSVSEDKQVYHCFGCKRGGDIFKFLELMRGLSFPEAIEYLAERAGLALPKDLESGVADAARENKKQLYKINQHASVFFEQSLRALPSHHPAKLYLEKRGLSGELCDVFKIGYSPAEGQQLVQYLDKVKAPGAQAERVGLIKRRSAGTGAYDLFRDRLMFPILAPSEEILGFGGRVINQGQPKYLNSPDSPLFHKGRTLYGLHATARFLRSQDEVIIVEGYMDLIALYGAGVKNVVATLGTALTPEHARLLHRYTRNVIVLFDGDAAGISAAERSLPILLEAGLFAKGWILPEGDDPDDAVKKMGVESFVNGLRQSQDLFLLYLSKKIQQTRMLPAEKVQIVEEFLPILECVQEPKLKALYFGELRARLAVEERWLRLAVVDLQKKSHSPHSTSPVIMPEREKPRIDQIDKIPKEEMLLLNLMLSSEELLKLALQNGAKQILGQSKIKNVFEKLEKLYLQGAQNFAKLTILLSKDMDNSSLLTQHLTKDFQEMSSTSGDQLVKDCLDRLKSRHLKSQAQQLATQLSGAQDPETLEQFMNIQRERYSLKNS